MFDNTQTNIHQNITSILVIICNASEYYYQYHSICTRNSISINKNELSGSLSRVTRRVPLMEQEQLTSSEHLSSSPFFFSEVCVARSLGFCVVFVLLFSFLLTLVKSVLLQFTTSDYLFSLFAVPTLVQTHGAYGINFFFISNVFSPQENWTSYKS